MTKAILIEVVDGVMTITMNRPEVRNALNAESHFALHEAFEQYQADPMVRVAILTGAGSQAFCAGSDLKDRAASGGDKFPSSGFGGLCQRFELIKPVLALVNGDCIGGGMEMVLAADLAVSVPGARFGLPEPRVGLAASGGLHRLARHIGLKPAMEIALTGRLFEAAAMEKIGVINHVAEDIDGARSIAMGWARDIVKGAPLAISATKQMMLDGLKFASLSNAFGAEYPAYRAMLDSEDAQEGTEAFFGKRDPIWRGK